MQTLRLHLMPLLDTSENASKSPALCIHFAGIIMIIGHDGKRRQFTSIMQTVRRHSAIAQTIRICRPCASICSQ
eukprot:6485669-Amphidinium_carterae.2